MAKEKPANLETTLKKKFPPAAIWILVGLAALFAWPWVQLIVGTRAGGARAVRYAQASTIVRALDAYATAHEDHYPTFKNSAELTEKIDPYLALAANGTDEEDHHGLKLADLESSSRKAVWNGSLSGAKSFFFADPSPWVFYFPEFEGRYVVEFGNLRLKVVDREQLNLIIEAKAPSPKNL